jgi:hypothetical protein
MPDYASLPLDNQGRAAFDPAYGFPTEKVMTFAGGTTDDPGDYDGEGNPAVLFTVTGAVRLKLLAICEVDLASSGGTLSVGVTGAATALIASTTASAIDEGEIWHDNSPDASHEATTVLADKIISDTEIIQTAGTANITAGRIRYTAMWYPLTFGAQVTPA